MYRFILIPNRGEAVTSLLPYGILDTASHVACALAQRIVNEPTFGPLQCYRAELAEMVEARPSEIEVVVIDSRREAVFNAMVGAQMEAGQ